MTGQLLRVPKGTKPTSDKMAVFLDELMRATSVTKKRRQGEYLRMHGRYLDSFLGPTGRAAIREAHSKEYIGIDENYCPGVQSMGYRLADKFRTGDSVDYQLKRKPRKADGLRARITDGDPASWALFGWFTIAEIPASVVAHGWNRFAVDSVLKRDWYCSRCPNGRFHSSFTGIPRDVRKQLTLNGKRVVESDVSNCQAIFLGLSAQERLNKNKVNQVQTGTESATGPPTLCNEQRYSPKGGCGFEAVFTGSIRAFMEVACAGLMYEMILEEAFRHGDTYFVWTPEKYRRWVKEDRPLRRADVKKQFMVMAFSPVDEMKLMPIYRHFARLYPDVAEYLCEAKREERSLGPREKAHAAVANECQRLESSLMIDRVAWRLAVRFPLITIHDAIASLEEDADAVRSEITQAFREIGLGVKVETE